jgi:hypothetical protein
VGTPSILTYLGLVGPFACGLIALAVSRDLLWLTIGLLPAAVLGVRGLIGERTGITPRHRDSVIRKE